MCRTSSTDDYIILLNDDVCCINNIWEQTLITIIQKNKNHKVFLLCNPNGFSGFAVNTKYLEELGGFRSFPGGYFEDDDFFLRCMKKEGIHTKKEIMDKIFYSMYDRHKTSLFKHIPNKFSYTKPWSRSDNKNVFNRFWKQVSQMTATSYENKNGIIYESLERD